MSELWEISDLVVDYDPESLERRAVKRSTVVSTLRDNGQRWGARIASQIPARDDVLDPVAVDHVLLRSHAEIQRLSEEFCQDQRVWTLLGPLIECLRQRGVDPIRVVDIGCGLGYVVRRLALDHSAPDIEWIGVDLNRTLVDAARQIARREDLDCRFHHANAFALDHQAHIFLSSGVIHHFRGDALRQFFAEQRSLEPHAFIHFDIQPSWASPIGAFLFHRARFREPLGQHDGYCSALRAHSGDVLLEAAGDPGGEFTTRLFDNQQGLLPIFRVMHAVVGVQSALDAPWRASLGRIAGRLGESR
ncbi:MAG: class I SAM-dependent methyltransferase [Persicimonas sp.]